jgi:iron complex outermembrane receptor protein
MDYMKLDIRQRLLASTLLMGAGLIATPAFGQTQPVPPPPSCPEGTVAGPSDCVPTPPGAPAGQSSESGDVSGSPNPGTSQNAAPTQNTNQGSASTEIVITGSLLRRTTTETPSPVTVLSAESLAQRGLNTAAEAVQRVSANNAGTIQAGWNTGFNFASGANAPSLRGLTVQNTLSIFDGLRMAPYPLADDGQRNFVDLNSIPDAIIDRIEVLRDGASSTYGADAIAGVVNVITKKEIQGLHLNGSYGVSQHGDARERRVDATWGYGDLANQGFNFYISGEYQKQDALWARDRGFPFNTQDLSSICGPSGSCMSNLNWNGISESGAYNGLISIPNVALVRPVVPGAAAGAGHFSFLNPAAGCRGFDTVHPVASSSTGSTPIVNGVLTSCEVPYQSEYIMLQPEIKRKGLSARATFNPADNHQIYAMGNYYQTDTFASFTPLGFNGTPTPPTGGALAYNVILPVYVCPTGVGTRTGTNTGCTAANGTLNPYNPYASADPLVAQTAQLFVRSTRPRTVTTKSRALRGVVAANGTILGDVDYSASFVASEVRLTRIQGGYLIPQNIMNSVARGEINFNDLNATPESVWDYISPDQKTVSTSHLWQGTGTLSKALFALPGGPLQAAIGVAYREEGINAPSANPAVDPISGNPYERYYSINSVGTKGSRNVKSAFFEVDAPFLDLATNGVGFEANFSGRYDKYSTGQHNFSPKVGAKFTPIRQLAIRGTWSKGFRIPSFNESFGLPTTGYVTRGGAGFCATYAAFCTAHGGDTYANNPFPVGLTQTGNPDLAPEKSTNITAGAIFEPIRNLSFTVDYWNIKIKNLIVAVTDISPVLDAYYLNNGVVNIPGITVVPGAPDPNAPNALPHIGFIQSSYKNADSQIARGIDFGANARFNLMDGVRLNSSLEASYLLKYKLTPADGSGPFSYAGTLSPCNITSCSGAPTWRGSWQNTVSFGKTTISATVYYTQGLDLASTDFGGIKGDCEASLGASVPTYEDGTAVMCSSKDIWDVDLTASQKIGDMLTIYANVLNVLNTKPPFDPAAAYGLFNFNPAFAGPNIIGRYFRLGAKLDLNPHPAPPPVYEAPPAPPPPPPAPPPATQTCADGSVILATDVCPAPPPPPPPPAPAPERG